jgi:hypothetical protein
MQRETKKAKRLRGFAFFELFAFFVSASTIVMRPDCGNVFQHQNKMKTTMAMMDFGRWFFIDFSFSIKKVPIQLTTTW